MGMKGNIRNSNYMNYILLVHYGPGFFFTSALNIWPFIFL